MTTREFEAEYKKTTGNLPKEKELYTAEFVKWLVAQYNKLDREYNDYINNNPIL
jgi:hypothetical protein